MKLLLPILLITTVFADNHDITEHFKRFGESHQTRLDLNSNSNINSYIKAHGLSDHIAVGANVGAASAKKLYSSGKNMPNSLHNLGKQAIQDCKGKTDPRCSMINKYSDDDVQDNIQRYRQGFTADFAINSRPDPNDINCSIITRKAPINPTTKTCTVGAIRQHMCTTMLYPYNDYINPYVPDGTVVASGNVSVERVCGDTWANATATVSVKESLTKNNKIHIIINSNSNGRCNNAAPQTFSEDISMNGINQRIYHVNELGCGKSRWDMLGEVWLSGSCTSEICTYSVSVKARHGGVKRQCVHEETKSFVLKFKRPKPSFYDGGVKSDDQCAKFKTSCNLVNLQCRDKSEIKTINGRTFKLADICAERGLSGDACCWNSQSQYSCNEEKDNCDQYRKNTHCKFVQNVCVDKDYISGACNTYQSEYSCAKGYADVESRVCINLFCGKSESGNAGECFNPMDTWKQSASNSANMTEAIAQIQKGMNMSQGIKCKDPKDPKTCSLFQGKYFSCYLFATNKLGGFHNNRADCSIQHEFFEKADLPLGFSASDRNLYSEATSGTNNVLGSSTNFGLSNSDTTSINKIINNIKANNSEIINKDKGITFNGDISRNPKLKLKNSLVDSVYINQDMTVDVNSWTGFRSYLSTQSINLAWNRQKAEPDPNNINNITFEDLQITRPVPSEAFKWYSGQNKPIINGLCVHLADMCNGGDDRGTYSDWIKASLGLGITGGFTNDNFCARCIFPRKGKHCGIGQPREVIQQWCCFDSKVAMDINLAAYDQGLIDFYRRPGNRYSDQIYHDNDICGGLTFEQMAKIDFSKGNYFKDLMSSFDFNKIIDTSNFTDPTIVKNTQNRLSGNITDMVNKWKQKNAKK